MMARPLVAMTATLVLIMLPTIITTSSVARKGVNTRSRDTSCTAGMRAHARADTQAGGMCSR